MESVIVMSLSKNYEARQHDGFLCVNNRLASLSRVPLALYVIHQGIPESRIRSEFSEPPSADGTQSSKLLRRLTHLRQAQELISLPVYGSTIGDTAGCVETVSVRRSQRLLILARLPVATGFPALMNS